MSKKILLLLICTMLASAFAVPVFAQTNGDFFGSLQQNLPQSTSTQERAVPQQGKSETVISSSTPSVDVSSSYQAYDAGQDQISGYLAGGAAVLAVLVLVFALGFVLTHRHSTSEEN